MDIYMTLKIGDKVETINPIEDQNCSPGDMLLKGTVGTVVKIDNGMVVINTYDGDWNVYHSDIKKRED